MLHRDCVAQMFLRHFSISSGATPAVLSGCVFSRALFILCRMSVAYERYEDEIEAPDDGNSNSSHSDEEQEPRPSTSDAPASPRTQARLRYWEL